VTDEGTVQSSFEPPSAPVWTFAIAGLICGILYAIVTPPFGAPDERSHFLRAWYVSEGHLGAARRNADVGVMVPPDVRTIGESLRMHPMADPGKIRSALHAPPAQSDLEFKENSLHAYASPVAYVQQALGIAVGRAIGVSPLLCFYLGRFTNVIASVLLIALAIRIFPAYRWLVALIALTPMANHLRGSLSLDATTMGICFLFLALVTRLLFFEQGKVRWRIWMVITVLAGLVCLTKINYAPVAALPLLTPDSRFRDRAAAWGARLMHLAVILLAFLSATLIATRNWTGFRPGVSNPQMQVKFILGHPLPFAKVLWLEHVIHGKWYLISMVGDIGTGYSIVHLPKILIVVYFLGIVALLAGDTNERVSVSTLHRLCLAAVCAASTLAIALAIYTTWNRVRWDRIDGLQGRYYLPFIPAAFFIFHHSARGFHERLRMLLVVVLIVCSTVVALNNMVHTWYPAGWRGWSSIGRRTG
jgi:uncharacterized membrane protein